MFKQELVVIRFKAATDEDRPMYDQLYQYFASRSRCGVVGHQSKIIKDMYLLPLPSDSHVHSSLMPFTGPGQCLIKNTTCISDTS